jgi:hypothetical protein
MTPREHAGNLSGTERTWSAVIGTALPLLLARRGSPVLSTLAVAAGVGLLARAITGSCAVKAAIMAGASGGKRSQDTRGSTFGRDSSGGGREPPDAQESVEEYADPVAVQEGLGSNEAASGLSAANGR